MLKTGPSNVSWASADEILLDIRVLIKLFDVLVLLFAFLMTLIHFFSFSLPLEKNDVADWLFLTFTCLLIVCVVQWKGIQSGKVEDLSISFTRRLLQGRKIYSQAIFDIGQLTLEYLMSNVVSWLCFSFLLKSPTANSGVIYTKNFKNDDSKEFHHALFSFWF